MLGHIIGARPQASAFEISSGMEPSQMVIIIGEKITEKELLKTNARLALWSLEGLRKELMAVTEAERILAAGI